MGANKYLRNYGIALLAPFLCYFILSIGITGGKFLMDSADLIYTSIKTKPPIINPKNISKSEKREVIKYAQKYDAKTLDEMLLKQTKIAFKSGKLFTYNACIMNVDGNERKQLTDFKKTGKIRGALSFSWSSDGEKIIFGRKNYNVQVGELTKRYLIEYYLIDANGSNIKQITRSEAFSESSTWDKNEEEMGDRDILWEKWRKTAPKHYESLTDFNNMGTVSWSPDGKKATFTTILDAIHNYDSDIFLISLEKSSDPFGEEVLTYKKLIDSDGEDTHSSFSPDGRKIVFSSNKDNKKTLYKDIYIINPDGTGEKKLTDTDNIDEICPKWSSFKEK